MSDSQAGSTTSQYEVLARLSQGSGTAELFAARAAGSERLVVIKRLRRDSAKEKAVAQAFLAEARVAAKLAHPNVAQVFEVGKLGGAYFFTTEFVDGETIRALVAHARGKKIQVPIRAFLTIAAGAASGLHHAHERNGMDGKSLNITHGDISPTNVMISREGIVKVLDFGSRGRAPTKLAYASPEQVKGEKLDRRSDLFSLGAVLWELLTLGELFQRSSDEETRQAIENDEAPAPSLRRFDVPPELDAILVKLVAKKPEARYQTCGELLAAIDSLSTKLGFSLSTNDLARMMRLWFGAPTAATETDELKPVSVASEDILADAPAGTHPVDEQLGTLPEAATRIRELAQRLGGASRSERPPTQPPSAGEVEDARENFAQIRDRILEQARKRKTTKAPPLSGQAITPPSGVPAEAVAAGSSEPTRKKPETLNSANNAYAFITKVAETATAPQTKATAVDAGMALKALQATSVHADAGGNGANGAAPQSRAVTATYDAYAAAAAAEEVAKAAERAEAALASASEPAASTEEGRGAQGTIEAKSSSESSAEGAPVAKIELSASSAALATSEPASEAASTAKPETKSEAKAETKSDAKAEAKSDAKAEPAKKPAADAKSSKAANDEKPANKSKTNGVAARASTADDDEKAAAKRAARSTSEAGEVSDGPSGRPGWLVPAVLVVAAALLLIFVMKSRGHNDTKKPDQVAQNQSGAGNGAATNSNTANTNTGTTNTGSAIATGSATAMMGSASETGSAAAGSATATGSATTMAATPDAAVAVMPVDAAVVAEVKPDAAVVATNTGTTGTKTNTGTTGTKTNTGNTGTTGTKTNTGNTGTTGTKTNEPAKEEEIEDLFAKGDYAKTNKACTKNLIFTPERLQDCALSACHATNVALAKRWVNAIAKAARPDVVAQCKTLGVDLEAPPAP